MNWAMFHKVKNVFRTGVFVSVLFAISACQSNYGKDVPITRNEAKVSIVGDDSFVTSRYKRTYRYSEYEGLKFKGGYLSYAKAHGVAGYINTFQASDVVFKFNRDKAIKRRNLEVSSDDVQKNENQYGSYLYVSKGNENGNCAVVFQVFGHKTSDFIGDQTVNGGACWQTWKGSLADLDKFVHDLMARVRFDDGAINKAKSDSIQNQPEFKESTLQAQRSISVPPGFERYQSNFVRHFQAFANKSETGRWGRSFYSKSPKNAIDEAINSCERRHEECRLYALGDTIVEGMSPEQIAKVAQDYYAAVSPLMAKIDFTKLMGKRLSSEEILEHLSNAEVEVLTYNDLKYGGRWQSNGTMWGIAIQKGIEIYTGDNGTWSVSGDKLCRQWQKWLGGRHECLVVTKDGSRLRAYDIHGDIIEMIDLVGKIRVSQQES